MLEVQCRATFHHRQHELGAFKARLDAAALGAQA
jgi:hypothetical protein